MVQPNSTLAYNNTPPVLAAPKKQPVKKTLLGATIGPIPTSVNAPGSVAPIPTTMPAGGVAPASSVTAYMDELQRDAPTRPVKGGYPPVGAQRGEPVAAPVSVATRPSGIDPAAEPVAAPSLSRAVGMQGGPAFPPGPLQIQRSPSNTTALPPATPPVVMPFSPIQTRGVPGMSVPAMVDLGNRRAAIDAASAESDQRMAAQQPPAPSPITGDQAYEQGRRQGIGGAFGMTGPAGQNVTDYYDQQRAREASLAESGAALNARLPTGQINPETGLPRGLPGGPGSGRPETYSSVGGSQERTFFNAPLRNPQPSLEAAVAGRRQMIPMTEEQRTQALELQGAQTAKDMARSDMRQQIAQAGGMPQKRGPLASVMDTVLGRKPPGFDPSTLTPEQQNTFADVQRGEAAKAKRAAYLAGTGEYAGRGPQDRARAIAAERAPVTAQGQQDLLDRKFRMSGGPQQQQLQNFMAARNPALALGMMRGNQENQRAVLDAQIKREELGIQRDELAGRRDDAALARVDAMKARRDDLALDREKLGAATADSRAGREATGAQDERQHAETMGRLDAQGKRDDAEAKTAAAATRAAIRASLAPSHPNATPEELDGMVQAEMDGKPYAPPGTPSGGTVPPTAGGAAPAESFPEWVRGAVDPQSLVDLATAKGMSDEQINELLNKRFPGEDRSTVYPEGYGLIPRLKDLVLGPETGSLFGGKRRTRADRTTTRATP